MLSMMIAAQLGGAAAQVPPSPKLDGAALARRMVAEVPGERIALQQCYRDNVLRLGASSIEGADTLLRGMRVICGSHRARLRELYAPEAQGNAVVDRAVAGDVLEAEDIAVAALLEARAKSAPGEQ